MKIKAARYYNHGGPRSPWQVAIYHNKTNTAECPHDWEYLMLSIDFRRDYKCGSPNKNEVMVLELTAKVVDRHKEKDR